MQLVDGGRSQFVCPFIILPQHKPTSLHDTRRSITPASFRFVRSVEDVLSPTDRHTVAKLIARLASCWGADNNAETTMLQTYDGCRQVSGFTRHCIPDWTDPWADRLTWQWKRVCLLSNHNVVIGNHASDDWFASCAISLRPLSVIYTSSLDVNCTYSTTGRMRRLYK